MKKKKICIIGAGWYGCHIGLYLKDKGHEITIFEKKKNIFLGSSGYNQYRLHRGFHYPRSSETIQEIKKNFTKFYTKYKNFVFFPKNNLYCIAKKKSLIDEKIYQLILKNHKLKFKKIKNHLLRNIEGVFISNEGVIKNNKFIQYYRKKLKKNILFNKNISNFNKIGKKYDSIIDCTNNTLVNRHYKKFNYILTLSAVYKKRKNKIVFPITIMDGKLPSLYPYSDVRNQYTLTHSKYTHIKKFKDIKNLNKFKKKQKPRTVLNIINKMEKSLIYFYPDFKKNFIFQKYFFSYKVLPEESSDKRSIVIKKYKNIISCTSPKIINIFSFQEYLEKLLKKY